MYRIVHNEQTGLYRVEKRGLFGWAFISDQRTGDYLGFADVESARAWIKSATKGKDSDSKRWKVVSDCNC
ncbi:MAG: hypothetical protein H6956_00700 [Chromatiaceae bacterium]|nr:hypothetical protein [Gammaproteobacteria bacterium]MCP5316425.1 hypothetical protein [Chromatiaceae bacterium]MCW5585134.1 hypothetical protein [Chromatiales bacterium]MCP5429383.1 hypothetical protein [Chromatiaceae bacterium]HOP17232.1 hypothetical protein [Gammaproteobacteria bacterium]